MDEEIARRVDFGIFFGILALLLIPSLLFLNFFPNYAWLVSGIFCFLFGFAVYDSKLKKERAKEALRHKKIERISFWS